MTRFYFTVPGEALTPEQLALGFVAVPIRDPGVPNVGYAWELGNPQAIQVNGVWQQNWVQVAIPLAEAQAAAEFEVMATLAAKLAAGYVYNGVTIDISTQLQRSEIAEAYSLAQAIQSGTSTETWKSDRVWPPMAGTGTTGVPIGTPQAMIDMAAPIGGLVMDLKLYAGALVGQIMAATSSSAVQTILSNAIWPTS